ncbi:universal stress protein [Thiopseudomonas acetoxidans]|uniref:Universal stress protein n=1 Tax=Thiopseudomonas acetoxidans TaxID=3041622 RepID=A0ABT7SNZ7_9GAMM|nr:universal stress protein [Thiopseudomonas sp. CY1220]MCK9236710.1 universal stress protein [Thiopseudomonas sp.]MCK9464720.1 universal stress protein [Thiopseudomonas sp.]MDM7857905.1 universal stress protein [Thiopseudomonas sp. CY1220]
MQQIIACIDESTGSTGVEEAAIWVAGQLKSPLMFLHSIEKQPLAPEHSDLSGTIGLGARSKLLAEIATLEQQHARVALQLGKELLTQAKAKALEAGHEQVEILQRHGPFVEALLDLESTARLVVIGHSSAKTDKKNSILGTHLESLLRQINTPVLIAPPQFVAPKSFMLAYDGRQTTEQALQRILSSDLLRGLDCHLVTVKNKQVDQEEKFTQAVARLTEGGFKVTAVYLQGDIFKQLLSYQQIHAVDMLVMGVFGGTRLRQFFVGSNTLKMLENSSVPILVMK